jgi:hypothetical protein
MASAIASDKSTAVDNLNLNKTRIKNVPEMRQKLKDDEMELYFYKIYYPKLWGMFMNHNDGLYNESWTLRNDLDNINGKNTTSRIWTYVSRLAFMQDFLKKRTSEVTQIMKMNPDIRYCENNDCDDIEKDAAEKKAVRELTIRLSQAKRAVKTLQSDIISTRHEIEKIEDHNQEHFDELGEDIEVYTESSQTASSSVCPNYVSKEYLLTNIYDNIIEPLSRFFHYNESEISTLFERCTKDLKATKSIDLKLNCSSTLQFQSSVEALAKHVLGCFPSVQTYTIFITSDDDYVEKFHTFMDEIFTDFKTNVYRNLSWGHIPSSVDDAGIELETYIYEVLDCAPPYQSGASKNGYFLKEMIENRVQTNKSLLQAIDEKKKRADRLIYALTTNSYSYFQQFVNTTLSYVRQRDNFEDIIVLNQRFEDVFYDKKIDYNNVRYQEKGNDAEDPRILKARENFLKFLAYYDLGVEELCKLDPDTCGTQRKLVKKAAIEAAEKAKKMLEKAGKKKQPAKKRNNKPLKKQNIKKKEKELSKHGKQDLSKKPLVKYDPGDALKKLEEIKKKQQKADDEYDGPGEDGEDWEDAKDRVYNKLKF